ncbi:Homoserine O-acetyltransferase [Fusarium odoratissimum]|uniref:Homoserine O-acetyltransferase n=1 Tax=Fusarium oxysporum f. sp. cubense (strain race 4) TaxID=2502994 RepID=N1RFL4_FUSC4|nr:Homoserine O-acetyltransferase [Fusarium odoratissimum]
MQDQLPTQLYTTIDRFVLESGGSDQRNRGLTVKGQLNTQRTNAVVICHALSSSADVKDWWDPLWLIEPAISWSESQLATIKPDSKFRGGRYGGDPPRDGLAAARMAAMISYRTHSSFEKRFGRRRLETCTTPNRMLSKVSGTRNGTRAPFAVDVQRAERDDGHYDNSGIFLAQSYLRYQGEKFNARFDANCYLHILDKIDSHDIARVRYPSLSDDEAILKVLSQIRKPTLIVGVPTDGLYPPSEQIFLSQGLKNATFATLQSDGGHDAFLIQDEQLNELLRSFFGSDPDL